MTGMGSSRQSRSKVMGLITARGGSKGLTRKNLLEVDGKPLISWTIDAALDSNILDRVFVSSEDDEILGASRMLGCEVPFVRPSHLATDEASSIEVVLHAIEQLPGFDYVVVLQPTSPLRTAVHIDEAFAAMKSVNAPSCVSVCRAQESPYWMYQLNDQQKLVPVVSSPEVISRRQDLPIAYKLNGAIYIAKIDWLLETRVFISEASVGYVMNTQDSLDIDSSDDFRIFRNLVAT
jgi:CMP-N,N'-diacetyllegionaminic acid synthase